MNYIQKELHRQAFLFAELLGDQDSRDDLKEHFKEKKKVRGTIPVQGGMHNQYDSIDVERIRFTGEELLNPQLYGEKSIRKANDAFRMLKKDTERMNPTHEETKGGNHAQTANQQVHLEQDPIASSQIHGERELLKEDTKGLKYMNCKADSLFTEVGALPDKPTVYTADWTQPARDLSRLFQRDARRYDGGYPLY